MLCLDLFCSFALKLVKLWYVKRKRHRSKRKIKKVVNVSCTWGFHAQYERYFAYYDQQLHYIYALLLYIFSTTLKAEAVFNHFIETSRKCITTLSIRMFAAKLMIFLLMRNTRVHCNMLNVDVLEFL